MDAFGWLGLLWACAVGMQRARTPIRPVSALALLRCIFFSFRRRLYRGLSLGTCGIAPKKGTRKLRNLTDQSNVFPLNAGLHLNEVLTSSSRRLPRTAVLSVRRFLNRSCPIPVAASAPPPLEQSSHAFAHILRASVRRLWLRHSGIWNGVHQGRD